MRRIVVNPSFLSLCSNPPALCFNPHHDRSLLSPAAVFLFVSPSSRFLLLVPFLSSFPQETYHTVISPLSTFGFTIRVNTTWITASGKRRFNFAESFSGIHVAAPTAAEVKPGLALIK